MKKVSVFLAALALCAFMAAPAFAEMKTFSKVKLDVPAGWTASEEGPTVGLTAPDQSAAISITRDKSEGASAKDLAAQFSKELSGSEPTPDEDFPGGYSFTFTGKEADDSVALVMVEEGQYILIVCTGESDKFADVLSSMEDI